MVDKVSKIITLKILRVVKRKSTETLCLTRIEETGKWNINNKIDSRENNKVKNYNLDLLT
jgi:hypothetical protein